MGKVTDLHTANHPYRQQLTDFRSRLVEEAENHIGTKSVKYTKQSIGRKPDQGFDCSGFVVYLVNVLLEEEFADLPLPRIPRLSNKIFDRYGVFVQHGDHKPGDLIFFSRKSRGLFIDHIGIVKDDNHYVHAPGANGTRVQEVKYKPWEIKKLHDKSRWSLNPVGYKRFAVPEKRWLLS